MGLKLKMSLLCSSLLLAAIGGLSGVLLWSERQALADGMAAQRAQLADGLAEVCRATLYSGQDLLMANYLRRLAAAPEVLEAVCEDASGGVVGHTDVSRMGARGAGGPRESGAWEASVPVEVSGRRLGLARIFFSPQRIHERLEADMARARWRILRLSAPVVLAGFLAAFALTYAVLRPMGALVRGARAIGVGKWGHRIPTAGADEMGLLAREFNGMAEKLGELDRMKRDFVDGVTHDLKTPLTAIQIATDLSEKAVASLPNASQTASLARNLFSIREKTESLKNLVTSILEVAHIESGLVLHRTEVDLEALAERVARSFRGAAERKGLALEVLLEEDPPRLWGDAGKLERVFNNLVSNAVKFTERGRVTLSLGREGNAAVARVADTGPGISPEFMDRLFTKFSRAEAAHRVEGSGLGLAIVKGIVEAHGGAITARSVPGEGTTFTVKIPSEGGG